MTAIIWAHRQPRHLLTARLLQGYGLRYQSEQIAKDDHDALGQAYPSMKVTRLRGRGWGKHTWIVRAQEPNR